MSLIISQKGQPSVKVDAKPFGLEDKLQEYIHKNPEAIPLYDIKDDIRLSVLVREFPTNSGPIDAIGVDKEGEIYLIETKLYKNADKRKVVAQVMDYAASLWSNYRSADSFINDLSRQLSRQSEVQLVNKLQDFFGLSDAEVNQQIESIKQNLNNGNFKLVVLMDSLHQQLKDLIVYINQNSEFDIFAVELEYYQHQDFEITIPKLFGAQVKKDITRVTTEKRILSDDDYLESYKSLNFGTQIQSLLDLFNRFKSDNPYKQVTVHKTPKYLNFYIKLVDTKITISIHQSPSFEGAYLNFWYDNNYWTQANYEKLKPILEEKLPAIEVSSPSDSSYGKFAKWSMKEVSAEKLEDFIQSIVD